MKEIQLTRGMVAMVDDEDFEYLNEFKWCAAKMDSSIYAIRPTIKNGKKSTISMHRCIISEIDNVFIDHINGNGLNNQRSNLRRCNDQQNQRNRRPNKGTSSDFKGVRVIKSKTKKYTSRIKVSGITIHIGNFYSEIEAAKAYDIKAKELFGEFAWLNFP